MSDRTRLVVVLAGATLLGIYTGWRAPAVPPWEFILACTTAGVAVAILETLLLRRAPAVSRARIALAFAFFVWWGISGAVTALLRRG